MTRLTSDHVTSEWSGNINDLGDAVQAMLARLDPFVGVGARHHTVPRFWLERFAAGQRVLRLDMRSKKIFPVNIKDLALKDFYTFESKGPDGTDQGGGPDASIEQLLAVMEGGMATLLRLIDDDPSVGTTDEARHLFGRFLSYQFVRGVRQRMEIEIMAEYTAKIMMSRSDVGPKLSHRAAILHARRSGRTPSRGNGGWARRNASRPRLSEAALRQLAIRPHPNEHIKLMAETAPALFDSIRKRPVTIVDLDQPLLLIGDEPVVVLGAEPPRHRPECALTPDQRDANIRRAVKAGRPSGDFIHIYPTRPLGLHSAEEIIMPISPTRLVVFNLPSNPAPAPYVSFEGDRAREVADEVNAATIARAYLWVAAHPEHPAARDIAIPDPSPLFGVCDRASAASEVMTTAPNPASPQRLRKS